MCNGLNVESRLSHGPFGAVPLDQSGRLDLAEPTRAADQRSYFYCGSRLRQTVSYFLKKEVVQYKSNRYRLIEDKLEGLPWMYIKLKCLTVSGRVNRERDWSKGILLYGYRSKMGCGKQHFPALPTRTAPFWCQQMACHAYRKLNNFSTLKCIFSNTMICPYLHLNETCLVRKNPALCPNYLSLQYV